MLTIRPQKYYRTIYIYKNERLKNRTVFVSNYSTDSFVHYIKFAVRRLNIVDFILFFLILLTTLNVLIRIVVDWGFVLQIKLFGVIKIIKQPEHTMRRRRIKTSSPVNPLCGVQIYRFFPAASVERGARCNLSVARAQTTIKTLARTYMPRVENRSFNFLES